MSEETLADATNNLLMAPGASREQQDFLSHLEIGLQIDTMKHFWLSWCTRWKWLPGGGGISQLTQLTKKQA